MYMKKISYKSACFLTLLITAMFMLYGCNSKSPVSSSDSENINSYNSDLMHSSYNKNENDIYSFVQVSGKLSRSNVPSAKFFTYTARDYTVSLIKDNIQLLKIDDINTNPELVEEYKSIVENEKSNCHKAIKAIDYYTADSTGYDNLADKNILFTNQDFNPVISKVTYIDYDNNECVPKEEWFSTFKQILVSENKLAKDTPIIFRESWAFNHNGNLIEIVTANNIVSKEKKSITKFDENTVCYLEPITPKHEVLFGYKITVIFMNGEIINTSKIVSEIEKSYFNFPTEDINIFTDEFSSYQYDQNNAIQLCPLYAVEFNNSRTFRCWDTYMYLDVDNDNSGELIEFHDSWSTSWLPGVIVYEIDDFKLNNSLIGI